MRPLKSITWVTGANSLACLLLPIKKWGSEEAVRSHPIDELLKLYVRINAETKTIQNLMKKLANGSVN